METRAWTPQEHPRLFFGKEDLKNLREKRNADDITRTAWLRIQENSKEGMNLKLPQESDRWEWDTGGDNQKNLKTLAEECGKAVSNLAFSWLMDGNESHARKATDILMALCDFDFWTSPRFFGTDYRLPWRGTIETAAVCHCASLGYDWLYDFMSEAERHRLRTCLLYKGILPLIQDWADPLTRLPLSTHMLPWGNWWQGCIANAGEAIMAIYDEHPLTKRFAKLCKEASDWFFRFEGASVPDMPLELLAGGDVPGVYYPPNFDSEGGYWEGFNYMNGVLFTSFFFSEAYRRQTGGEIFPTELMRKVTEVILNGSFRMGDRMRAVNFGDCRAGLAISTIVTGYLASRLQHPGLQWYLQNCQNNFNEASLFSHDENPICTLLWYDHCLSSREPEEGPLMKVYPGMGLAVMRNGWGNESSMLVLKCGATAGHSHADAGSFVLYTRDELLLIDSGCCGYEMPEQNDYYHTTRAHNTVLVGDDGQIKRLDAKFVEEADVPGLSFVLGDATAPYEGLLCKFLRGVLFIGGEYYVVADWLEKQNDKPFKWLLHYDGEMTQRPEGCFIKKAKANLLVKLIEPSDYQITVRQGYKTYHEDYTLIKSTEDKQKELEIGDYMEIMPANNINRQKFLTILYPFGEDGKVPKIEKIVTENWTGVRVRRKHEVDLIGINRDEIKDGIRTDQNGVEKEAKLFHIDTDAKLFCITMDKCGEPLRAFMQSGTHLKSGGRLLVSSPEPATIAVEGGSELW
ncbi:MAG: hypothetical protein FIA99_08730 [Ruminiclostridium sp.]|nr:hypothetical protein [Ruminiclostridium sp.]